MLCKVHTASVLYDRSTDETCLQEFLEIPEDMFPRYYIQILIRAKGLIPLRRVTQQCVALYLKILITSMSMRYRWAISSRLFINSEEYASKS